MKIVNTISYICEKISQRYRDQLLGEDKEEIDRYLSQGEYPEIAQDNIEDILEDSFDEKEQPRLDETQGVLPVEEAPAIQETLNTVREEIQPQQIEDVEQDLEKDKTEFKNPIEAIFWAEPKGNDVGKVVTIWYKTKGGRDIKREIEPHGHFFAKKTGNNIVVAFDRTVGDIRAFIANNIIWADPTKEEFNKKFNVSSV